VAVVAPTAVDVPVGLVVCGAVEVAMLVGIPVAVSVSVAVAPAGTVGVSVAVSGGRVVVSVGVDTAVGSGTRICPSVHSVLSGAPAESVAFAAIKPGPEHDNGNACPAIAVGEIATEQV
jgi:hypothetical protein